MPGRAFLAICAALALTASAPPRSQPTTLSVAGRSNGTPWIAADGRFVAVAWGATAAGKTDVFAAVSRNGGQRVQPRQVIQDHPLRQIDPLRLVMQGARQRGLQWSEIDPAR